MDISIIGGTGEEGFGLTLRLAKAGNHVTIGSRSQEKGEATAAKARDILGEGALVDGTTNEQAAASADVVVVTVPFEGQALIYRSIKGSVPAGRSSWTAPIPSPLRSAVAPGTSCDRFWRARSCGRRAMSTCSHGFCW